MIDSENISKYEYEKEWIFYNIIKKGNFSWIRLKNLNSLSAYVKSYTIVLKGFLKTKGIIMLYNYIYNCINCLNVIL